MKIAWKSDFVLGTRVCLDGFCMPIKVPLPELFFFGGVVRRKKMKLAQLHPRLDFDLHHSHRVLEKQTT